MANLLPQDTRTIEICCAVALLAIALLGFSADALDTAGLVVVAPMQFWSSVMLVMGGLQLFAVSRPDLEVLRAVTAWTNGLGMVWLGLTVSVGHVGPSDASMFMLGLSNLYAAVIGAALLLQHK